MHMEAHTIVTVTDRIKVAMAKGGADISRMGGISDAKLEAMSDSAGQKVQLEYALENSDLPVEEDTLAAGQICNDQDAGDGWSAVLGGCLLYVKK